MRGTGTGMDDRFARKRQKTDAALKKAFFSLSAGGKTESVKAADVCQEAGIARSTFYSHYECYEDFVKEIADELIDDARRALSENHLLMDENGPD